MLQGFWRAEENIFNKVYGLEYLKGNGTLAEVGRMYGVKFEFRNSILIETISAKDTMPI